MIYFLIWALTILAIVTEIRSIKAKLDKLKIILDLDMRQTLLYDLVALGINLVVLALLTYLVFVKDSMIIKNLFGM